MRAASGPGEGAHSALPDFAGDPTGAALQTGEGGTSARRPRLTALR